MRQCPPVGPATAYDDMLCGNIATRVLHQIQRKCPFCGGNCKITKVPNKVE